MGAGALLAAIAAGYAAVADAAPRPVWSHAPFRLEAGGQAIDTQAFDTNGHAAPFVVDLDEDGRRDLVLGGLSGQFRFFRNVGSDAAPRFAAESRWLMAESAPARIMNWCCMAAAPQFADVDGDGKSDLSASSYGGPSYWFKGLGGGDFKLPHQLLAWRGHTLLAREDIFSQRDADGRLDGQLSSYAANHAWTKWDRDGEWDLILGNHYGQLFVFTSGRAQFGPPGLPEFRRVAVTPGNEPSNEILIDGQKVLPANDTHAAPAVADWDGDGLWDILIGSKSGNVYLLRNSGRTGAPEFKSRELLVEAGQEFQMLREKEPPAFGTRTQIHATDFNGDGRMDLLVGSFAATVHPRPDLSEAQRAELVSLWRELADLDEEIGNWRREQIYAFDAYSAPENKERRERAEAVRERMRPYLSMREIARSDGPALETEVMNRGHVWVFLRK